MSTVWILPLLAFIFCAQPAFSQGGKAEPKRLEFLKGRSSVTVSGTLANGQEMDHIFKASAGQKVSLSVTSMPKGKLFVFHLKGQDIHFETDHDSYTEYSFIAPVTGDSLVFVRKRPTQKPWRAKFFLKLVIK